MKSAFVLAAFVPTVLIATASVAGTVSLIDEIDIKMKNRTGAVLSKIGKASNEFVSYDFKDITAKTINWNWTDAEISYEPIVSLSESVAVCVPQITKLESKVEVEFENTSTISKNVKKGTNSSLSESMAIAIGLKEFGASVKATGTFASSRSFNTSESSSRTKSERSETEASATFEQDLDLSCSDKNKIFGPLLAKINAINSVEKVHSKGNTDKPATYSYDVAVDMDRFTVTSRSPESNGDNMNVMLYDKNQRPIADRNYPGGRNNGVIEWNDVPNNAKFINVAWGWGAGDRSVEICHKKGKCALFGPTNQMQQLPYGQKDLGKIKSKNATWKPGELQTDVVHVRDFLNPDEMKITMSGEYTVNGVKDLLSSGTSTYTFYNDENPVNKELIVQQCGATYEQLARNWDRICGYDPQLRASFFKEPIIVDLNNCPSGQTYNGTQEMCMDSENRSPNAYYLWNNKKLAKKSVLDKNNIAKCKKKKNWKPKKLECG